MKINNSANVNHLSTPSVSSKSTRRMLGRQVGIQSKTELNQLEGTNKTTELVQEKSFLLNDSPVAPPVTEKTISVHVPISTLGVSKDTNADKSSSLTSSSLSQNVAETNKRDRSPLMLDQRIKQEDVSYTQVANASRDRFGKNDFREKGFVKQWAAEQTNQKLRQVAMNGIMKKVSGHEKIVTSHPNLAVPTANALKFRAQYYHEKYNVIIRTTELENLAPLIAELQSKVKEPMYIGILVIEDLDNETSHVTPLLCYFDGKKDEDNQFLVLDGTGGKRYVNPILEHLHSYGISRTAIKHSNKIRQADNYSCRTSSITLLRNALLSLSYHKHQNGFDEALKAGKLNADQTIDELPPDWDYAEQISNKISSANTLVIRHYFSKKPEKRSKQETIGEYRQRYTENVTTQHELWENSSDYRKEFAEIGIPEKEEYAIDKDTTVYAGASMTRINFTQTRQVNVYLLKKGLSNQSKDIRVVIG